MTTYRLSGVFLALVVCASLALGGEEQKPAKRPFAGAGAAPGQLLPQETLDRLNLNDEQKEKVAKVRKEFEDKNKDSLEKVKETMSKAKEAMEKARQDKDRDAARKVGEQLREANESMQKLRKDLQGQLSGVLNDEQKKKLEESFGDAGGAKRGLAKPGERPGRGADAGAGFIPPALQEKLNLTAEQKDKLKQLQKEFEEKAKGVLTDEQKKQLEEARGGKRRKTS